MKVGLIMPVACKHQMQAEAWTLARQHSRPDTPIVVLFNGCEPRPLPHGVESVYFGSRFSDEADLWRWCLELAICAGWEWCMMVHDDFAMCEPGWEVDLEQSAGYRVALASWLVYSRWDEQANTSLPSPHHIGVCLDSMSFGFKTSVFAERGCVVRTRYGYGYGAWDACIWALQHDYAVWHILLNSDHQWIPGNTRAILNVGASGHPDFRQYAGTVLPAAAVDQSTIEVCGRRVCVAPPVSTPPAPRVTRKWVNYNSHVIIDSDAGTSEQTNVNPDGTFTPRPVGQ